MNPLPNSSCRFGDFTADPPKDGSALWLRRAEDAEGER
jgi:hypothetical protein